MTPFGEKLRDLRKQHGMTMASMAQHLGVSSAYLSQVEHGGGIPRGYHDGSDMRLVRADMGRCRSIERTSRLSNQG